MLPSTHSRHFQLKPTFQGGEFWKQIFILFVWTGQNGGFQIWWCKSKKIKITYYSDTTEWSFWAKILAKSDFLGSMKDAVILLGHEKILRLLWVVKKGLRDFFGYAKDSSEFFGLDKFWSCDFFGIKYEPLLDPPPPIIKICEWGPWVMDP